MMVSIDSRGRLLNSTAFRNLPEGEWLILMGRNCYGHEDIIPGPHNWPLFGCPADYSLGLYEIDPTTGFVVKLELQ